MVTLLPKLKPTLVGILLLSLTLFLRGSSAVLYESDRVEEYHRRQHTWPPRPDEFLPSTEGWRRLFERRFRQIDALQRRSYDAYMVAIRSALILGNFTETGWGLTRAPTALWQKLHGAFQAGLASADEESMDEAIDTQEKRPLFIPLDDALKWEALLQVQPIMEAWSGVKLVPNNAYGLRVYRNATKLYMHTDRHDTHVISSILHVYHDTTAGSSEPWPLVIEGFDGQTVQVQLEPGDLLLYESSKCYHGRPKRFRGEYYTSLFLHYYPVDHHQSGFDDVSDVETHYRVPPHWNKPPLLPSNVDDDPATRNNEDGTTRANNVMREDEFEMIDTFCRETNCEHEWFALQDSPVVQGPAPGFGKVLTTNGRVFQLQLHPDKKEEKEEEL